MISIEILQILTPIQKLPKNVEDLGKLIDAKGFKNLPKTYKSPNLVTLEGVDSNMVTFGLDRALVVLRLNCWY